MTDEEKTLLIVDDDKAFLTRLARAMEQRGFAVTQADSVAAGIAAVDGAPPAFAVIDMRLGDGNARLGFRLGGRLRLGRADVFELFHRNDVRLIRHGQKLDRQLHRRLWNVHKARPGDEREHDDARMQDRGDSQSPVRCVVGQRPDSVTHYRCGHWGALAR